MPSIRRKPNRMMRSGTVFIPLAVLARSGVLFDKIIDNLFNWMLKAAPLQRVDLDNNTLGKLGRRTIFLRASVRPPLLQIRTRSHSHSSCCHSAIKGKASGSDVQDVAYKIAVLGAGVAGSVCTTRLLQMPGVAATVYDMGSRGPGGRACSRPVDGHGGSFSPLDRGGASSISKPAASEAQLTFDHGVQAFSVTHEDVQELLQTWLRNGFVKAWEGRFGVVDARTGAFSERVAPRNEDDPFTLLAEHSRYVGVPSMSSLARGMLDHAANDSEVGSSLTLLSGLGCRAMQVNYSVEGESSSGSRWTVKAADGSERHFDAVVVAGHSASFAAGIAANLPSGRSDDSATLEAMRRVSYPDGTGPLYALLVAFEEKLGERAPFEGAAILDSAELRWLSRDSSKPGRDRADGLELWVALSTEEFAQNIVAEMKNDAPRAQGGGRPTETQLQTVAARLLAAMGRVLHIDLPTPVYFHAQRWQAGITRAPLDIQPSPCVAWEQHGLVACGDWAGAAAKVEEAARSGLAAADALARLHKAALHMRELVSKAPPVDAEKLAVRALAEWPEWRCDAHPGSPSGRFQESRWWEANGRERAMEERCFVTAGWATLWPEGGGAPVEIIEGDWVTFQKGFQCTWVVHKAIAKRYAYFDKDGNEISFT